MHKARYRKMPGFFSFSGVLFFTPYSMTITALRQDGNNYNLLSIK